MERPNNNSHPIILALESSCDDTAAAILMDGKIRSNVVASQKIHEEFGGVVPEWASRKHQQNVVPTVQAALDKAGVEISDVGAIACTQGPGLMGSLLVGHTFTKGLSMALDIPFLNVDHIEAHILAHFIDEPVPSLPFLCLLVSGGHTQIVRVEEDLQITILGRTLDDAAGEAFDKAGKMLDLPYPAGPVIDRMAETGDPYKFQFSTSNVGDLDFSFSGLKTSILYFLQREVKKNANFIQENIHDLCASIQHTIVSYLMSKLIVAMERTGIQHIGIAGGVAANSALRSALAELPAVTYIPRFEYCTDNAAMIANVGRLKLLQAEFGTLTDVCYTRK